MTTVRAWISAQDVCALALVRDLRAALRGRLDGETLQAAAQLPAFQALLRERCLDADARDHVLLDLEPGMLAALRVLGFCGAEHEGVPVCIRTPVNWNLAQARPRLWKNPFTGVRTTVEGGLAQLKTTPGFLARLGGRAPAAAGALDAAVREQLSLLQFGPPGQGRRPRPASFVHETNSRSLSAQLTQILLSVEKYVSSNNSIKDVLGGLEYLRRLFVAEVESWLLQSQEAAGFRNAKDPGTRGNAVPLEVGALPKDSILRRATEQTAELFAERLEEFVACAALAAVNGLQDGRKDKFVGEVRALTEKSPAKNWRLFWFRNLNTGSYRLAIVEVFEGKARSRHEDIYSLYHLSKASPDELKNAPFEYVDANLKMPGEQLVVGLSPSGLTRGPKGEDIEEYLTLQTRTMSHLGDYLHKGVASAGDRERDAAPSGLSRRAAPGPEDLFGIKKLSHEELKKTAVCKRAEHLTPEDQERIMLEMTRHIQPSPPIRRRNFMSNFETIEDKDLATVIEGAVERAKAALKQRGAVSARREIKLVMSPSPLKFTEIMKKRKEKLQTSPAFPAHSLDLDTPDAANLVRFLLCQNCLPCVKECAEDGAPPKDPRPSACVKCEVAYVVVAYFEESGRRLVETREYIHGEPAPPPARPTMPASNSPSPPSGPPTRTGSGPPVSTQRLSRPSSENASNLYRHILEEVL